MGIVVGLPTSGGLEKDLQLSFSLTVDNQIEILAPFLPARWFLQSGVQLTWLHTETGWAYIFSEIRERLISMAHKIVKRKLLLIITLCPKAVKNQIAEIVNMGDVRFLECETNDTWAHDHRTITLVDTGGAYLLDFTFSG